MLFEIILSLFLGIIAGVITGLLPGIHTNLIATTLILFLPLLDFAPTTVLIVFITSMVITNSFVSFIPAVFLGAPEDDDFLSVLPGHQMLKKGRAHEAVVYTLYGSLVGLVLILLFTPVFLYGIPFIFNLLRPATAFLLLFLSLYIIFREEKIMLSLVVFLMAGFLGYASLHLPIDEPLLSLLSGLFGSSALVLSLKDNVKIPKQEIISLRNIRLDKTELLKASRSAIVSAPFCSIMPGLGAGHAATIASEFGRQTQKSFLVLLGAISTVVEGLSFVALYTINKARTGAAVAVGEIVKELSFTNLMIILSTIIFSGSISFFVTLHLSKLFSRGITQISYFKICLCVLVFMTIAVFTFSNWIGIVVFISATSLGVFTILSGSRRINLMGCLLMPVIIFYIFSL